MDSLFQLISYLPSLSGSGSVKCGIAFQFALWQKSFNFIRKLFIWLFKTYYIIWYQTSLFPGINRFILFHAEVFIGSFFMFSNKCRLSSSTYELNDRYLRVTTMRAEQSFTFCLADIFFLVIDILYTLHKMCTYYA